MAWNNLFGLEERRGLYFGPLSFNLIFRPVVSLVGGIVLSLVLYMPLATLTWFGVVESNPINFSLLMLMTGAFAMWFGLPDEGGPGRVPEVHAAMLTFLGFRIRVYITEGHYGWIGRRLFLGKSSTKAVPGTDENGFIYLGEIPVQIWNSADEVDKQKATLTCVARDSSSITTTLVIILQLFDPYLWLSSQDPLTDIAERARAAFRTSISFFVGTDVASVKSVLGQLMSGRVIITAFLQKTVGTEISRSLLENRSGVHQYIVKREDESVDDAKRRFVDKINANAAEFDPSYLKAVRDSAGNIVAEDRSITETLDEVADAVGAKYLRASVGNIMLSDIVRDKANEAASEVFQRDAQVASATAIKAARLKLKPTKAEKEDPNYQDAAMVAAAQDNPNINVTHVTGSGDRLSRATVAAANQLRKGK